MAKKLSPGLAKIKKTKGLEAKIAKRLRISRQAVSNWKKIGVPLERLSEVSRITGIPPEELRPDIVKLLRRGK